VRYEIVKTLAAEGICENGNCDVGQATWNVDVMVAVERGSLVFGESCNYGSSHDVETGVMA
jgi:hypoxanthine phosphoribosyltransferase